MALRGEDRLRFDHRRIDQDPPAGRMGFCLTTDLSGNGRPDVLIGAMGGRYPVTLPVVGKRINLRLLPGVRRAIERLEWNVFWYENPGWDRHEVARAPDLSIGGSMGDLTGNGRVDLVAGQNLSSDLYWFEQPADPRDRWTRRLITDEFIKYHDTAVADVDDDGEPEVLALSQRSETVFYYDVPDDPTREPWPAADRHVVAEGLNVEGVAVRDVDGDGRTEILAGTNVFHRRDDGSWEREAIATGWDWTRLAVADLDGDGDLEVVAAEGDLPYQGDRRARLAVFDPPDWEPTLLHDDLSNPHTVQVLPTSGAYTGGASVVVDDGAGAGARDHPPDLFVAEMGLEEGHDPRQFRFRNRGDGTFEAELLATGVPTHEATVVDLDGDGRPDVVGKGYESDHVDVWYGR